MRQTKTYFVPGRFSKYCQSIIKRLYDGQILDKVEIGKGYYGDVANVDFKGQNLITGLRKKIERYTGKILICRKGKYKLIFESELGEAVEEMNHRRKRVVHAMDSFSRPAEFLLTQDNTEEMKQVVNGSLGSLSNHLNKFSYNKLAERASKRKSLPHNATNPKS